MTISSRPLRPPRRRTRSATRSLFTAGTVALVIISGTAGALAQPTTTPNPAPSASPDAVPAQRAPAPVDPCATPTTTAPTTTTTVPPTTTTAVAPSSCDTVPATLEATTSTVVPPAAQSPAQAPAAAQAPAPVLADAPLPAEPAGDQPLEPENDDLSSKTAEPDPDWAPTEDPNATVVPGEMRSDREEIPAPFTKEDADKAETMEARQRMSRAAAGCQTYWPSPYEVCGVIRDKYNSLGGPASFLSFPNSPEYTNPNNTGKRTQFLNGPIYWSAATGAHPVVNSFLNRWGLNGYEAGWLHYPTTDEIVLPDGGRRQEFQDGVIYVAFQNAVGSAIRNGPLRDKYNTVGGLTPGSSFLGYPTQDQIITLPGTPGQMARFQFGVIYWHPTFGAFPISGDVLQQWAAAGYERSRFGYPTGDAQGLTDGTTRQTFQTDQIHTFGFRIATGTSASITLGMSAATALQSGSIPNGVAFTGPGFTASVTRIANDGSIELGFTRIDAQAPSTFRALIGLPAGYTLQANSTRVNILGPLGQTVAGVGLPMTVDQAGNLVATTTQVIGNELVVNLGNAIAYPLQSLTVAAGGDTLDQWWSTGVQQKQVCEANPYDCIISRNARGPANNQSVDAFPDTHFLEAVTDTNPKGAKREDNRVDAARHCIWNGLMTEQANRDFAQQMANAHEADGRANPAWNAEGELMDEYNNETGQQLGLRNEDNSGAIISNCIQYARDARLVPDPSTIDLSNDSGNDLIALRHP